MKLKYFAPLNCALLLTSTTFGAGPISGSPVDGTNFYQQTIVVGNEDPGFSLLVTNAGVATSETVYVGQYEGSDQNIVTITGNGSILQATNLVSVGEGGKNNDLIVKDSGNLLVGTEAADFSNGSLIAVGDTNGTAELKIQRASQAYTDRLVLGGASNLSGRVSISGSDSSLTVNDSAFIGQAGSGNQLTLSSGGTLNVSNLLQIGSSTGSNNVLRVNNGGTVVLNGTADILGVDKNNRLELRSGGQLTYHGDANLGNIDDSGLIISQGATLEIGGTLTLDQMNEGYEVILNGGLSDSNSVWDSSAQAAIIGNTTGGNTLTLKDGAKFISGNGNASVGVNSNGNILDASGADSEVEITGGLRIGQNGSQNEFNLSDGATADISEDLIIGRSGNNNSFILTGETNSPVPVNTLTVGTDFTVGKFGDNNNALFTGSNALATVSSNLFIGEFGNSNELDIESGAWLIVEGNAYLGTNGANNTITVQGTNSQLEITGSVWVGNSIETNDLTGNALNAFDTAMISIGGDLNIYNGSFLSIESGAQVTVSSNYYQDATSELEVGIRLADAGTTNLVVGGTATFESNTTIRVVDQGTDTNEFSQTIVSSSGLYFGGTNATTELLNDTNMIHFVNDLLFIGGIVTNDSIVLTTAARSLSERSGLVGTDLEALGDEIDAMAASSNTNAINMRNILGLELDSDEERNQVMLDYYDAKQSSIPAHNVINMGVQNVAEQLTMRADNTRYRQGMASSTANWSKPTGVAGPHEPDQDLQGWINGFGNRGSMDGADGFDGYDADSSGFMIGLDGAFNANWLIGFAGGAGNGSIDKDGADTDTKSIYGAAYTSFATKQWFADMGFIYGNHDIKTELGSTFDTEADYSSQNLAFFAGGGKEFISDYVILTPELSFLGNFYMQDSYEEKSSNAVGRKVDRFDTFLLQSSLGGSMGFYSSVGNVTFKPEIRAFWQHEWIGEEEKINYSLIGGTGGQYALLLQAPEKDILKIGIGSSAKLGDYLELRADLDTRFGKDYSDYTLLGSLRYQF